MKISFITDEVTQSFDEAVRFARQNGLAGLELRSVEDTAIDMLPAETLRTWRRRLDAEGLTVCGLAGSFYKCAPEPDAVEAELAKLERLCAAADIFWAARSSAALHSSHRRKGPCPPKRWRLILSGPYACCSSAAKRCCWGGPQRQHLNHAALARLVETHRLAPCAQSSTRAIACTTPWAKRPIRTATRPSVPSCPCTSRTRCALCRKSYCVKVGTGQVGYPLCCAALRRTAMRAGCPWRPITVWIPT